MRVPLKYMAEINRSQLPETAPPDLPFRYVDIGSVAGDGSLVIPREVLTLGAAPSRARRLAPDGATVISTVRTYLRALALVPPSSERLVFSTGFAVLEAKSGVDARFLHYACRSERFVQDVVSRSTGVSYPAITANDLGAISIDVPRLDEQRRIADFLDDQVALMDRAVALRQHQGPLLEAHHWNSLLADVAAAGGPWVPIRRMLSFLADGPFGSAFTSGDYADEGAFVVRLGNIGFAEFRSSVNAFIPTKIWAQFPRCHVRPGDLLIAGLGDPKYHAGRACVAPDLGHALVKGKCFCARIDDRLASAAYLALVLSSPLGADLFSV